MEYVSRRHLQFLTRSVLITTAVALLSLSLLPASSSAAPGGAPSGTIACLDTSATLEALIDCTDPYLPASWSQDMRDGFVVPTEAEMAQWRDVVTQMMDGQCDTIDLTAYGWGSDFTVTTFVDHTTPYCVLMETQFENYPCGDRTTRGWGTFITNPRGVRDLNISAPHPISDMNTTDEAVAVFKGTRSRTFLISGAHRLASDVDSNCQSNYKRSDAAHNSDGMFQATIAALKAYYDSRNTEFYHLQFHGMSTCCETTDVHMSHGSVAPPEAGAMILELRDNLLRYHPDWRVSLSGDAACSLNGTENVQGRLLNGVAEDRLCWDAPLTYPGYFVHIEQCREHRLPDDWLQAIEDTWPVYSYYLPFLTAGLAGGR